MSRGNWLLHIVEADIVRDAGLAYREVIDRLGKELSKLSFIK